LLSENFSNIKLITEDLLPRNYLELIILVLFFHFNWLSKKSLILRIRLFCKFNIYNDRYIKWSIVIFFYLTNCFREGANFVKLIPFTAVLYSSIVGVLPKMVERTTTGVDESNDSPFFS
jgi:hypothetical protein